MKICFCLDRRRGQFFGPACEYRALSGHLFCVTVDARLGVLEFDQCFSGSKINIIGMMDSTLYISKVVLD